jgi:hypothetical protein
VRRIHSVLRSPNRVWLGRLVFTTVLVAVLGFFVLGPPEWLDKGAKLAAIAALLVAAATLALTTSPVRAAVPDDQDEVASDLAELVQRQWAQEAAVRPVRRPQPLTVRWSSSWQAAVPAREVFGTVVPTGRRVLRGDVTDLAVAFGGVPA